MDTDSLDLERVDHRFKGLPADAAGLTVAELAAQQRSLFDGGFTTPVLTLGAAALEHNLTALGRYAGAHGLSFAPHGKTSMAPRLFERQLAHGAWGITAATAWQARVYRAFGVQRIFLANEVVDPAALRWLSAELAADPGFALITYVDSVRGVELMDRHLTTTVDVVVELGADGGRTGVRDTATADAVADAVAASAHLRLTGVAGYEGELPVKTEQTVRAWLEQLLALARRFDAAGRFARAGEIVVSAGGSAWFDTVAAVLEDAGPLSRPLRKVLRSGAYVTHDDGHYEQITPFRERAASEGSLRPALRLWTHVVSRPEPGLALLNAGKRDAPMDMDLPVPLTVRDPDTGAERAADGLQVTGMADQHTFVRVGPGARIEVGDWVSLGVSHPCTTFDKWRLIPVVQDDGTVTDLVRTFF
ncbi:amino acid deaminase [Streptomyces sp. SL13]|uniref:Amino acid deaminase n=1 Tax=Streptantibioticus silvisoli TaxID=2705255 RepID=A0AA90H763_9ACTN|nr:amino acid deaminase [Streptantibioticus silvisoli]MDI5963982.1 amino acid deaminase [Streptantibioticus silvisoli]MDI5970055.1 amino acid deaminase [Streptantibioticus silvisoli]